MNRAHYELGLSLVAAKEYEEAVAVLREARLLALASRPTRESLVHALGWYAVALRQRGEVERCVEHLEEALKLDPENVYTLNQLAWILAASADAGHRDGRRAVRLATRACELEGWANPNNLDTLAAASAETGEYDKAVDYQTRALGFPAFEKVHGAEARDRLKLYERKQPYRVPPPVPVAPPPRPVKP